MDMKEEIALKLEASDRLSHIDLIHALRSDGSTILFYDEEAGLAIRHSTGTVFTVAFRSLGLDDLYEAIGDADLCCTHSEVMYRHYLDKGYRCDRGPCYIFSYEGEPLDTGDYQYRIMGNDEADIVVRHYGASEEYVREEIGKKNIFAIEKDGTLMGFGGFHSEGSMGILEIFPEYRRQGIGYYMESYMINEAIRRGIKPFCNVYTSNEASIRLQEKLGLKRGKSLLYWLWKE